MKPFLVAIGLTLCIACNERQKTEVTSDQDTTVVLDDTVVQEINPTPTASTTSMDSVADDSELLEEKGKFVYVSRNEFSYISDPYDFSLNSTAIEDLLGEEARTKVQEFEAGEDYSAYTYTTIIYRDTEISFYDYSGKHTANITTPQLPLKNGIVIGMKKVDFLNAMGYIGANASKAAVYRLLDDYGQMEFSFRADTLYNVYVHYEEGD
jgi:hypothetical protein